MLSGIAALLLISRTGGAQENSGFPFVIPWDDGAATLIDLSYLNAAPAGRNGRIVARGEHLIEANTGRRVRLFGVAFTFDANFPEHAEAEKVVKRLAKYGVNAVRIHYMDAGSYGRRTIWDASKGDFRHIDPAQRDRLDYLLAQFKKRGIYLDINLLVARRFAPQDGFPDSVNELPGRFSKRVDHFDSRMIELQKEYARDLLTHRNPYTGMTLATDPGVYAVEINNENTLLGFDSGAGLLTLPQPFRGDLQKRWNAWLLARHGNTAGLKRAWDGETAEAPPGPELLTGDGRLDNTSKAQARLTRQDNVTRIAVLGVPAETPGWRTQLVYNGLDLKEGQRYVLSFSARSEQETSAQLGAALDQADWRRVGLRQEIKLTPEWHPFRLGFVARATVPGHTRLVIELGDRDRTVEFRDLSLRSGLADSLVKPGESLEARTVPLPAGSTGMQRAEWFYFLYELEARYAHEMRSFLKKDLGVQSMVICSQMNYGTYSAVYREAESDYSDYHVYWDNPERPGGIYDSVGNVIKNEPMTADLRVGTFQRVMQHRVPGRPFSISEYNHPAPNEYTVETLPLLVSLGSRQDMDVLVLHEYGPYGTLGDGDTTKYKSYFAVGANPSKWAFVPAMALAFRTRMIGAAAQVATAEMPAQFTVAASGAANTVTDAWKGKWPDDATYNWQTRLFLEPSRPVQLPPTNPETQVSFSDASSDKAVFVTATPGVRVITGYVSGRKIPAGDASFEFGPAPNNFAALTCVAWDGKPLAGSSRVILTCAARVHNTGETWRPDHKALTSWGRGPVLVDGVDVKVELPASGPRRVWGLDETGAPKREIPAVWAGGKIRFAISTQDKTVWWAVTQK